MNTGRESQERRANSRLELLEYAIITKSERVTSGASRSVVTDVSLGGLQVRSRDKFECGTCCRLNIGRLMDAPLEIDAEVRYCKEIPDSGLYSTGFRVLPASPDQRSGWADFVHSAFMLKKDDLS